MGENAKSSAATVFRVPQSLISLKSIEEALQIKDFIKRNWTPIKIRIVSKLVSSYGGPEGIRTLDLSDANRTLSQLSYKPKYEIVTLQYIRPALPAELQARTLTLYTVFSKMQEGIVLSIAYVEY